MKKTEIERLRKIAENWHSGLHSAMYQFASSGVFVKENTLRYLWEAQAELINYGKLREGKLSISKNASLKSFIKGMEQLAKENGILIEWDEHIFYSYKFPVVANQVNFNIHPIHLLN